MEEAHEEVLDLRLLQLVAAEQAAAQRGGRLVLDGRRHQSVGKKKQRVFTSADGATAGDSARLSSGSMISLKLVQLGNQSIKVITKL